YLLCRATHRDAGLTYRVDRVHSATVGTDTFTPPAPLDPVEALETHLGAGWDYPTEVLIDGPLELCQGYLPRTLGRLSEVDEGTTRLAGTTSNAYGYAEALVRLPVRCRVVGGPQLRDAVRELGERMLAAVHVWAVRRRLPWFRFVELGVDPGTQLGLVRRIGLARGPVPRQAR